MKTREIEINKIINSKHSMVSENVFENQYKMLNTNYMYRLSISEIISQEIDLIKYIEILKEWK